MRTTVSLLALTNRAGVCEAGRKKALPKTLTAVGRIGTQVVRSRSALEATWGCQNKWQAWSVAGDQVHQRRVRGWRSSVFFLWKTWKGARRKLAGGHRKWQGSGSANCWRAGCQARWCVHVGGAMQSTFTARPGLHQFRDRLTVVEQLHGSAGEIRHREG
jgi:hypothetical protein